MTATWARREGDTLTIVAFDDFLRVTMDVVQSDTTLSGIAVASSDADVVRDSAGRIREYRHDWTITARKAACEDILRENPASILPTFD